MTNPNNAVGTNAAYGGRTSVNAFNDDLSAYSRGVLSGWTCSPSSGLTVALGGNGTNRDVAIAEDPAGNKATINNISGSPINVTLDAAPASNSRIDLIVAYVVNPPEGTDTIADNPAACGIIPVKGTAAASPVAPNDSTIRSAITSDGASGATAYYVVLAQIAIASSTTDIVAGNIAQGASANIGINQIADGAITSDKIDFTTLTINSGTIPQASTITIVNTPGRWLVFAFCTTTTPADSGTPGLHLMLNGTVIKETYCGNTTEAQWENLVVFDIVTLTNGDSLTLLADKSNIPASRSEYIAIRI
ncbi:hypothetical protein [Fibrobacter sp.]|uniref:hypothetical protein n=1 Tax=Fibrobacter sp. TaxID=35828 RepID=UPI00388D41FB